MRDFSLYCNVYKTHCERHIGSFYAKCCSLHNDRNNKLQTNYFALLTAALWRTLSRGLLFKSCLAAAVADSTVLVGPELRWGGDGVVRGCLDSSSLTEDGERQRRAQCFWRVPQEDDNDTWQQQISKGGKKTVKHALILFQPTCALMLRIICFQESHSSRIHHDGMISSQATAWDDNTQDQLTVSKSVGIVTCCCSVMHDAVGDKDTSDDTSEKGRIPNVSRLLLRNCSISALSESSSIVWARGWRNSQIKTWGRVVLS